MSKTDLPTDTSPVTPIPRNRWWVRPAFGMLMFGFLLLHDAMYGWWFEGSEIPTVSYLFGRLLNGFLMGLFWGLGMNWAASWGKKNRDPNGLPNPPS